MSDPLRTGESRASEAASNADRDAKIEQLLLVGLDHYFAAQYQQAIDVWTRALFLDRSHARARAYIERARSALAERQRESEELLQNGVAAFQRGDGGEARRLLQAAVASGAPSDEALALLDRLNRLEAGTKPRPTRPAPEPPAAARQTPAGTGLAVRVALRLVALAAVAGVIVIVSMWSRLDWHPRQLLPLPVTTASIPPVHDAALPLPRRGETALLRARSLAQSGHLHEALSALEAVTASDLQRPDADRLRADIQRQLLGLR